MRISAPLLVALAAEAVYAMPQTSLPTGNPKETVKNPKIDPADGPVPAKQIEDACVNMFTQPNPSPDTYAKLDGTYGGGKYSPAWFTKGADSGLPNHTIYLPKTIPEGVKMPIVLWGNGGCGGVGTFWMTPLIEWASHGIMVIADGNPPKEPSSGGDNIALMRKSLEWIKSGEALKKYPFLDTSRIGVSGQSCGGLIAYQAANDPGVTSVGIFNSGGLQEAQSLLATKFKNPVAYFLGGSTDIAYANGNKDYKRLPKDLPAWKGHVQSGHGGTYCMPRGGEYGLAGTQWWRWTLRGDESAKAYFTGEGARNQGWQAVHQSLDNFKTPSPLPGN